MKVNDRINALREEMSRHNIGIYIVPACDFHCSEYIGEYFRTREYMSGFTGSAGTLVVTMDEARLWTDGRYFLQAEAQLENTEIILMKMKEQGVPTIPEYLKEKVKKYTTVGFDGRCISAGEVAEISEIPNVKIISEVDLVGDIWSDRPQLSCEPIWKLEECYAGVSVKEKIRNIRKEMKRNNCSTLVITRLDEIAWTLNLRGNDIPCTPVFLSFMAVTMEECILFVSPKALNQSVRRYLKDNEISVFDYQEIYSYLETLSEQKIWIDISGANYNLIRILQEKNELYILNTPVMKMKSIKNETEIANIKNAHIADGVAMTKFIYWLKHNVGRFAMSEISLAETLEEFRKRKDTYIEPSFETIVGYQEHGAIVHYSADENSNKQILPEGIVLIDSGGHYLEGTTDITRTISLGTVSEKMKEMYTAVLKGHLNLAGAVFKEGKGAGELDIIARKPLRDRGVDYNHGTGHGVGYLLSVHESPRLFQHKSAKDINGIAQIVPGIITSDEPGVYIEGEFGIRIENLILCKELRNIMRRRRFGFSHLTLVPYDMELICLQDMTEKERKLLFQYHTMVYDKIASYLDEGEKLWLAGIVKQSKGE